MTKDKKCRHASPRLLDRLGMWLTPRYEIREETIKGSKYWMIYRRIAFISSFFELCNAPYTAKKRLSELTAGIDKTPEIMGREAFKAGDIYLTNPFTPGTDSFEKWSIGWWGAAYIDCPTEYSKLLNEI